MFKFNFELFVRDGYLDYETKCYYVWDNNHKSCWDNDHNGIYYTEGDIVQLEVEINKLRKINQLKLTVFPKNETEDQENGVSKPLKSKRSVKVDKKKNIPWNCYVSIELYGIKACCTCIKYELI